MPIYRHSLKIQTRALAMIYGKRKKVPPIVEDQPPWEWTPTISASSKYIDIFYLFDKLFIQDPIIIMKCEYGYDRVLLKKYYDLHERTF